MKINGKELDAIILAGNIRMMNWDAVEKYRKHCARWNALATMLAVGLTVYMMVR